MAKVSISTLITIWYVLVLVMAVGAALSSNLWIKLLGDVVIAAVLFFLVPTLGRRINQKMRLICSKFVINGKFRSAERLCRFWIALLELVKAPASYRFAWYGMLCSQLLPQGRFNENERTLRRALKLATAEHDELHVAELQSKLGATMLCLGNVQEADDLTKVGLDYLMRRYQADKSETVEVTVRNQKLEIPVGVLKDRYHTSLLSALSARANLLEAQRRYREMVPLWEKHVELSLSAIGICVSKGRLGTVYMRLGDLPKAQALLEESLSMATAKAANKPIFLYGPFKRLGQLRLRQKRYQEADDAFRQSLQYYDKVTTVGTDRWDILAGLAQAKVGLGELTEADKLFEQAIAHSKHYPASFPGLAEVFEAYAGLLKQLNRETDAAAMEERAKAVLESAGAECPANPTEAK